MRRIKRFAPLLIALTLLSCASTNELVRRGEVALNSGNMDRAYDWSRRALDREPGNAQAREVMAAAASAILEDRKAQVTSLAALDTVAAARASLELDQFRSELVRYHVTLPPDPEFQAQEAALRIAAARIFDERGTRSLADGHPKLAYREFVEANRLAPGDAGFRGRRERAWEEAINHVAILPFNDEISEPGLARELSDEVRRQMEYQLKSRRFEFTRLVGQDRVNQRLTVAMAGHMTREEAVSLGRSVGATRVVFGRLHDLRTDSRTDTWRETIFHKVVVKDDAGTHTRYDEERFEAVARRREVSIVLDLEVIETGGGASLARDSQEKTRVAHTVFTRFTPAGSCDDYSLAPPEWKNLDRGQKREKEWRGTFGSWSLPGLLDRARREPSRTRYESRHRSEFSAAGTSTPVWLDDLPPVEDLAYVALADGWMPMLGMLKDLDGRDDAEFQTAR
jgi:hypothetical protein